MIPVARTTNILITEVDNEVMIYDRERDACHCLNPIATKVYYYADGRNTVDDIATFLDQELELSEDLDIRGLVWLALEELEKCHLLKEYLREPLSDESGMSRRKVLGKTTKFAGAVAIGTLFPMIQSVIAPKPAFAKSNGPTPTPPTPTPTLIKIPSDDLETRVGLNFENDKLYGSFGAIANTPLGQLGLGLEISTGGDITGVASLSDGPVTGIATADADGNYTLEVSAIYPGSYRVGDVTFSDPFVSVRVDDIKGPLTVTTGFAAQLPEIPGITGLDGSPVNLPPVSLGVSTNGNQVEPFIALGFGFRL
ncbi:MAG: hypothetical protein ACK58N_02215 [Synechocystis sp.]|jgi:hypothetical protein